MAAGIEALTAEGTKGDRLPAPYSSSQSDSQTLAVLIIYGFLAVILCLGGLNCELLFVGTA